MFAARTRLLVSSKHLASCTRAFHAHSRALVQVGDAIPDIELMENSPGNKISISKHLAAKSGGKGLIIGVPAAFSPSCSESHIPGYINHEALKDAGDVFVVSVNDAFVYSPNTHNPSTS